MLFAADVLARNPGAEIIFDVKCTRNLAPWVEQHGGKPLLWKTGHSLIKAKMQETGAALAGEMSGHMFFKERWYGFDDGLYAGARLLEILSRESDPGAVLEGLPDAISTPELHMKLRRGRELRAHRQAAADGEVRRRARSHHDRRPARRVRRRVRAGALVEHDAGRRAALRGRHRRRLKRIQEDFRRVILAVRPGASLPF